MPIQPSRYILMTILKKSHGCLANILCPNASTSLIIITNTMYLVFSYYNHTKSNLHVCLLNNHVILSLQLSSTKWRHKRATVATQAPMQTYSSRCMATTPLADGVRLWSQRTISTKSNLIGHKIDNIPCIFMHFILYYYDLSKNWVCPLTNHILSFSVVKYQVKAYTGDRSNAGTNANVFISLHGNNASSGRRALKKSKNNVNKFEQSQVL